MPASDFAEYLALMHQKSEARRMEHSRRIAVRGVP
jgi:hypothetical protein